MKTSLSPKVALTTMATASLILLLNVGSQTALAQEKPEEVSAERARANFGRQIVLADDDVRAFPDAPAGFDKPRDGKGLSKTRVISGEAFAKMIAENKGAA